MLPRLIGNAGNLCIDTTLENGIKQYAERPRYFLRNLCKSPVIIDQIAVFALCVFAESFDVVGISVDSLNPENASSMGRVNLPGAIHFIEEVAKHVKQVVVHSIDFKGETKNIANWCQQHRYIHVIQPLQAKDDYRRKYQTIAFPRLRGPFACPRLNQLDQRYYNLDQLEMPCCFIKDTSEFKGILEMIEDSQKGCWPKVCSGCSMGRQKTF